MKEWRQRPTPKIRGKSFSPIMYYLDDGQRIIKRKAREKRNTQQKLSIKEKTNLKFNLHYDNISVEFAFWLLYSWSVAFFEKKRSVKAIYLKECLKQKELCLCFYLIILAMILDKYLQSLVYTRGTLRSAHHWRERKFSSLLQPLRTCTQKIQYGFN